MEKVELKLSIEAERLDALTYFMSAKDHMTPQKGLENALKEMYEKYVPADTREYLDSRLKPPVSSKPRPKRPTPKPTPEPVHETEQQQGEQGCTKTL